MKPGLSLLTSHLKARCLLLLFVCITCTVKGQQIQVLTSGTGSSLRGLSVVDDHVVWVSGSNGRVARSLDGGKSWTWMTVKGFEQNDFRDIEAFDKDTAIIMAVAAPAFILKTTDGGNSWKAVYENKAAGMFLDAMDFKDKKNGIVIGDPLDGKFFIARTSDQGETWMEEPGDRRPVADSGEACFASSGTNIRYLREQQFCFISGGMRSRFFIAGKALDLPMMQGKSSTGANSIAVLNRDGIRNTGLVVVGGDFSADSVHIKNCFISQDGGQHWTQPAVPPHGYRSCVEFTSSKQLVTCGTSGVDISNDAGMNWRLLSKESFHICRKAKYGRAIFLAGGNGRVAKLTF